MHNNLPSVQALGPEIKKILKQETFLSYSLRPKSFCRGLKIIYSSALQVLIGNIVLGHGTQIGFLSNKYDLIYLKRMVVNHFKFSDL